MKTDDLVALLAKDAAPVGQRRLPMRIMMIAALGVVAALGILVPWLGIRPDLAEAAGGMTYWTKTVYTLVLGVAGFLLAERLARPGVKNRAGIVVIAIAILAVVGIAVAQLASTPSDQMSAALMGQTWNKCPWRIVVLSLPGLGLLLWLMRRFAPTRPMLAGAAAGLLAGGLGATVYGLFCQETSMPFLAIWYSLGVALTSLAGAIAGSRLLRW
ncbi:MAG TPA: DUF1109 domain-containing protein [Hyphomonadaceae bacterium]|nr:DUF1109 domain-containing protein [Hyphomonadaceae bacterium]